jgi:tripartite-type tricarboxylate transporter receptor subunit TctC
MQMQRYRNSLGPAFAALLTASLVAATPVRAEYPERPITLVVPFAPGGTSDFMARLLSAHLRDRLKQTLVVENKGGAGGNIGITAAARSKPDGYTLLVTSSSIVINPSLYRNASYDPLRDFVPVTELAVSPNIIAVSAKSDIKDLKDLIAKANANPGKYNYSTPGVGTTAHFTMEVLKAQQKIDIVHIPFTGSGPALQALIGGQVQVTTSALSAVMPFIRSGSMRALAVSGHQRWPELPDVPTVAEQGFNNAEVETFQAIFAPAGTPQAVIDRIAKETIAVFKEPAVRKNMLETGNLVAADGPKALAEKVAKEVPWWREMARKTNIKLN